MADQQAQMAMIKILSQPPETIMDLLNRFEIPWEKTTVDDEQLLIIRWSDFMVGERKIRAEGPVLKKLVDELKAQGISFSGEQINPLLGGN